MLIRKNYVYVDEKSIRRIRHAEVEEKKKLEEELERERRRVLEEARKKAKEVLEEARKRAKEIVDEAKERAKELVQRAEGAYKDEIASYEEMKRRLASLLGKLEEGIEELVDQMARETLPIVRLVVRKILEKEMDEELALRRIRSAYSKVMGMRKIRVRVNPDDIPLVEEEVGNAGFELVPDPNLERGDVVLETDRGVLNKSTEFMIKLLEDAMDGLL